MAQQKLTLKWNVPASCWMLDIADPDGTLILGGIPLVTGANLLEQFEHLDLPGQLIVQTDHNADAVPTYENLGIAGRMYWVAP